MKQVALTCVAGLALFVSLLLPLLFFFGHVESATLKQGLLAATVVWFLAAVPRDRLMH